MQIVIEIPEKDYEEIKSYTNPAWRSILAVHNAFNNAVVLPKGHGRLIDAERLYDDFESMDYDFEDAIDYAPTIVEADKEVK